MVQKKIALLGAAGVGKTSLVRRFVDSIFDEKYLTTIGVKIEKKPLRSGDTDVTLMIWDIAGTEENFSIPSSYVKGAAGYLLVADGTRPETCDDAQRIVQQIDRDLGQVPFVFLLNKHDLAEQWRASNAPLGALQERALATLTTSAKTGEQVDDAFQRLAAAMLGGATR